VTFCMLSSVGWRLRAQKPNYSAAVEGRYRKLRPELPSEIACRDRRRKHSTNESRFKTGYAFVFCP